MAMQEEHDHGLEQGNHTEERGKHTQNRPLDIIYDVPRIMKSKCTSWEYSPGFGWRDGLGSTTSAPFAVQTRSYIV